MKASKFLLDYLRETAKVTICNKKGDILYSGLLGEMPIKIVREKRLVSIDGLGAEADIFVTIC